MLLDVFGSWPSCQNGSMNVTFNRSETLRRVTKVFSCLKKNAEKWNNYPDGMEFIKFAKSVMEVWRGVQPDEAVSLSLD